MNRKDRIFLPSNTAERVQWHKHGATAYKEWISWIVLATTHRMIPVPLP